MTVRRLAGAFAKCPTELPSAVAKTELKVGVGFTSAA